MERFLKAQILEDLNSKMVFLAGPRQIGKTTLSKILITKMDYLNWDIDEDRSRILAKEFAKADLWIFDEIHKYKLWRNYLKGIFDKFGIKQKILVTGSAKLDVLRKGGDSLQGRYHFLRLMPLSCKELKIKSQDDLLHLFNLNGFPEPFFKGSKTQANRWTKSYRERIVREEVSSNEKFLDLSSIEVMYNRLPDLVGSTLSINSLAEDIQVSFKTVDKWINSLVTLYGIFKVPPFHSKKIKSLKKSNKIYFFDWNNILDEGTRFENFIAVHLLKYVYFEQDTKGRNLELAFYRDKYDREIDFIILENNKPIMAVEAKLGDVEISKSLKYFKSKYPDIIAVQVHLKGKKDYLSQDSIECMPALKYLSSLA